MKGLVVQVDADQVEAAQAALPGCNVTGLPPDPFGPDLIMSAKARYFEAEWWGDPKLVEVALRRARSEKRKKGKK